jgi:hypothetical protein
MRKACCVLVAVLMLGFCPPAARAQCTDLTLSEAMTIALQQYPGGLILLGRSEKTGIIWGFYILYNKKLYEVELVKKGGKMDKKQEVTAPSVTNVPPEVIAAAMKYTGAKLPMTRYIEIAKEGGGEPTQIKVILSPKGKLLVQVGSVTLDLATGKPATNN